MLNSAICGIIFKRDDAFDALPQLNTRKSTLNGEIRTLRRKAELMGIKSTKGLAWIPFQAALKHNHEYEALLAKASELGWEYQEVCGQVAIIEKDWAATLARGSEIPAHLRPQVFDVSAVAGSEALAEVA